jgi:pyocin large subunit-like protein
MSKHYNNRKCVSAKDLESCQSPHDFMNFTIHRQGTVQRENGEIKFYGPDMGRGFATLNCNHNGNLEGVTRATLIKAFLALGLCVIAPIACVLGYILSAGA